MSKHNSISPISFNLPSKIEDMTISELMHSENSEVHYKKGKLSIRNISDNMTATLEIDSHTTGRKTARLSSVPITERKSDYLDDVRQMLADGMKQKDIAFELGISEAYVTQLKKRL